MLSRQVKRRQPSEGFLFLVCRILGKVEWNYSSLTNMLKMAQRGAGVASFRAEIKIHVFENIVLRLVCSS